MIYRKQRDSGDGGRKTFLSILRKSLGDFFFLDFSVLRVTVVLFQKKLIVPAVCLVPQQCILISIQGNRTWENHCLPADIVIDCSFFHCWNGSICKNHVTVIIKYCTSRNATLDTYLGHC